MTSVALPVVDINEELPNLKKKRGFLGDSMQKMENSKKKKKFAILGIYCKIEFRET